jgi:hypothetical protein
MSSDERLKGSMISTEHRLDQNEVILAASNGTFGAFVHSQT